ncbi:hypothetical protein E2C01_040427 [Portunus trituberculatus]|uniref:Uncharacterized protein n=1 Tax=Portunus trituberculatus TaxID=210409 RepID=A0A5B7FJP4_PORTR|nr:hypothetical protein [Portunus trituberculatus]
MGRIHSSLKVSAHLEVVGQCGGADRLTLCLPRSRGKGGRRLLGAFSFPSAGKGAGQHKSAYILVAVGRVAKKNGTTPVRVDILAGESLVARREIPLADLLAGLKANRIGRRSALFFSLKTGQAEDAAVAVYYSRRLLDEPKPSQEDQQEQEKTQQHASLAPQAGESKLILPPYAAHTSTSDTVATLTPEVSYRDLTPKVTVIDLLDGQSWATLQAQPLQERIDAPQTDLTEDSLSPEVVHRDLGDGQSWATTQAQPLQERIDASQTDLTEDSLSPEVVHRDLGDGQRWASPNAQLRHRRGGLRGGREGIVLQPSIPSPSNQGKEARRDGRGCLCGPCLVVSLLQCAQAMTFTLLVYHVCLEWF